MSHMIRAKTKLKDKVTILAALDKLHWKYSGAGTVKFGAQADIVLGNGSVGLQEQRDGTWMIVGDPYYDSAYSRFYRRIDQMVLELQTQYNIVDAQQKLEGLGYYCIENAEAQVNTKDGMIQMVFESL